MKKTPAKRNVKSRLGDSEETASTKQTVGIPAGMPFRTRQDAAKRKRAAKQKRERIRPGPAKSAEPNSSGVSKATSDPNAAAETDLEVPSRAPDLTDEKKAPSPAELTAKQRLDILVKAAKVNEPGAVEALRDFLDKNASVYQHLGDVAKAARLAFATLCSDDSPLGREAIFKHSEELLKKYLPTEDHCPTEALLAGQIVVSSMRVNYFDFQSSNYATSTNVKLIGLLLKQQEQAQTQLFRAITKLETFRRLRSKAE